MVHRDRVARELEQLFKVQHNQQRQQAALVSHQAQAVQELAAVVVVFLAVQVVLEHLPMAVLAFHQVVELREARAVVVVSARVEVMAHQA